MQRAGDGPVRTPALTDAPLDLLRRRYGLTIAPAQMLLALLAARPDRPVRRETLARSFGRAHRAANVAPHLTYLRKQVGPRFRTDGRTGTVTLAPELRRELRAVCRLP